MAVNKVVYAGKTLVDLTGDTVTAEKLAEGFTAHDAAGNAIVGQAQLKDTSLPMFTYTGECQLLDDGMSASGTRNWRIKFFTSGTLTFLKQGSADDRIDVFLVGGGGGTTSYRGSGAGGGYTKTGRGVSIKSGVQYPIEIGGGGKAASGAYPNDGGTTNAFGCSANGGKGGVSENGGGKAGNGGSGGGVWSTHTTNAGDGGSDGGNGGNGSNGNNKGIGQGTTTREFGEANGKLYAGGGGGGAVYPSPGKGGDGGGGRGAQNTAQLNTPGEPNTGGGAGGSCGQGRDGGSGIVIIRNAR